MSPEAIAMNISLLWLCVIVSYLQSGKPMLKVERITYNVVAVLWLIISIFTVYECYSNLFS